MQYVIVGQSNEAGFALSLSHVTTIFSRPLSYCTGIESTDACQNRAVLRPSTAACPA